MHQRSVLSDYRTTPDHLSYGKTTLQDSGFSSVGSTYYKARENYGSVDTDGRSLTEFDSGRGHPKPKRNDHHDNSEFVLGGFKHVASSVPHQGKPLPRHQSMYSFVPPSSYRTHADERHPRQEMITPKLMNVPTHPIITTTRSSHAAAVRNPSAPVLTTHIGRERVTVRRQPATIMTANQVKPRKRSVSPQIERRDRSLVNQPFDNSSTVHTSMPSSSQYPMELSRHSPSLAPVVSNTQSSAINPKSKRVWHKQSIDMSQKSNREDTFISHVPVWSSIVTYMILVLSGFYYTGHEDIVKCNYCHVEIGDWDITDDVHERHFHNNPNCPYLRKNFLSIITNDICPRMLSLYADFGERYKSFQYWPIPSLVKGGRLAEAGFYFTKKGVQTQCYCCGIIKDDWTSDDDPIIVHIELCAACPHAVEVIETKKVYRVTYKSLEDRLTSYKNIDDIDVPVDKIELANAGFVLVRSTPFTVQCPDCAIIVTDWRKGDDPLERHTRLNKHCSFLITAHENISQHRKKCNYEDEGISETIQYPPSYKSSLSSSSNDSVSLPSQSSFDKEDMNVFYKRSMSAGDTDDDNKLCVVCFEYPKECAIIPCGHLCVCLICANKLQHCPICRQTKNDILKIFIP